MRAPITRSLGALAAEVGKIHRPPALGLGAPLKPEHTPGNWEGEDTLPSYPASSDLHTASLSGANKVQLLESKLDARI